jgi:predicted nucleotidyltransferase
VRALLAARWSLEKKTTVPMPFDTLKADIQERKIALLVEHMLECKKSRSESVSFGRIEPLDAWIVSQIADLERKIADFQHKGTDERENINRVFQNLVL